MKAIFNIGYTLSKPPASYSGNRRAEYMAQRNFYNLTADYNYFNYTLDGSKVSKNANAEHYFTREGTNTGLFNMDGPIDAAKKAELKERLKTTDSTIWHGFISFDDKTSLGFLSQENCVKFMRQTFGAFLERAGFKKSNIELYCSLHEDTAHRHIHFAFFEKSPIHLDKNGKLGYRRRGKISAEAIDNYLVSANMHLSERGAEYYGARDKAITAAKSVCSTRVRSGIMLNGDIAAQIELNVRINELVSKLPASGRLQYNAENMRQLRPDIDAVVKALIKSSPELQAAHNEMLKNLARVKREVEGLAQSGKLGYIGGKRVSAEDVSALMNGDTRNKDMSLSLVDLNKVDYFARLQNDYKARLGNIVLGMCKEIKRGQNTEFKRQYHRVNDKHRKIEAKAHRGRRRDLLLAAKSAMCGMCRQDSANFLKTVREHEYDIERENMYGSEVV